MQKSTELTTGTKTMQTNIDCYTQTTNLEILFGLMLGIGRLAAHHANLITNGMAHSRY
jgi:hypothetical protein